MTLRTMTDQAREIAAWGKNVYVKIPVTNTRGETTLPLIDALGNLNLNITAVMTDRQITVLAEHVKPHHIVSVFAGTDHGYGTHAADVQPGDQFKALWASTREVYHVRMAEGYGYDIITMAPDMIAKLPLKDRDLTEYSLATVRQFYQDGKGIQF
jgi:transaldolase